MSTARSEIHPPSSGRAPAGRWLWPLAVALVALGAYLSTLQTWANGSESPYATDVGEIQNALGRWGTIHEPGYPLYTFVGSAVVSASRLAGLSVAAGASLHSALWGAATAALLYLLARELGAGAPWAAAGALTAALGTSTWVDASLAEVHTMGAAFFAGTLLFAARYGRLGRPADLLVLVALLAHGTVHQLTTLFLLPAAALLAWPRLREALSAWPAALAVGASAPVTWAYLLLRAWQGSAWRYGDVGTLRGLLAIALDTKAGRVLALPDGPAAWAERARTVAGLLHADLWWPVMALGLASLAWPAVWRGGRRRAAALTLAWLPSAALALAIWEGRVSDALLAAKLPVAPMAGVGLALLWDRVAGAGRGGRLAAAVGAVGLIGALAVAHRPTVHAVTRDYRVAEGAVALAEAIPPAPDGRPTTLLVPWGHRYWALAYVQAFEGRLGHLTLVDHNADVAEIARRGDRLLTLGDALHVLPPAWWGERLGCVCLSSPAPGVVELSERRRLGPGAAGAALLDLGNGVRIVDARASAGPGGHVRVDVEWQAVGAVDADYAVAVHLLAHDPPRGPEDVLAQGDRAHPVDGWYPTGAWAPGEVVRDAYAVEPPPGSLPVAVRLAMYRATPDGGYDTTPWLTIPLAPP